MLCHRPRQYDGSSDYDSLHHAVVSSGQRRDTLILCCIYARMVTTMID